MADKFLKLIEQITDKINSGLQPGGLVKLVSGYKSKEGYKRQNETQQKYIDDYFDSDSNYVIKNITTEYPSRAPGNEDNRGNYFYVTVARELANGLTDQQGKVTVTSDMLEPIDLGINRHPVPDDVKYDNKVQIEPKEVSEEEEVEITRMTQQGDSLKKSEVSNPTQNTKIPSSPASPDQSVGNYTAQYMG